MDAPSFRRGRYILRGAALRRTDPLRLAATAAAQLLRLQGVPCRYVTGFNVSLGNRRGDHYVVREKDAHAWIEVYLPGKGWVEVDPTPPEEYEALTAQAGDWLESLTEGVRAVFAEARVRLNLGDWRGSAAGACRSAAPTGSGVGPRRSRTSPLARAPGAPAKRPAAETGAGGFRRRATGDRLLLSSRVWRRDRAGCRDRATQALVALCPTRIDSGRREA